MNRRLIRALVGAAVACAAVAAGAVAAKAPADHAAQAWNVLPPGQAGGVVFTKNSTDQIALYEGLTRLRDNVKDADLPRFVVGGRSQRVEISADVDHGFCYAVSAKRLHCAIDTIALRDCAEIQVHGRVMKAQVWSTSEIIELDLPEQLAIGESRARAVGRRLMTMLDVPELDRATDGRIERAVCRIRPSKGLADDERRRRPNSHGLATRARVGSTNLRSRVESRHCRLDEPKLSHRSVNCALRRCDVGMHHRELGDRPHDGNRAPRYACSAGSRDGDWQSSDDERADADRDELTSIHRVLAGDNSHG